MSDGGGQGMRDRHRRSGHRDVPQRQSLLKVRGRSVAWLPPLLLLVLIVVVDVQTPGSFRIISWIVLVPGISAAICNIWTTACFALLSVASYIVVDDTWPNQYQAGLSDFVLVTIGGALATLACAVRLRGERRMIHMRDIADTTRRTVLRPLPARWGGLEHAAVYLAADTEARVGGDFYDIQPGPHGTRVLVGDVQGKGLGAVETAAALLGTFRESSYHEPLTATVAERLETRMRRHKQHLEDLGRPDADRFATAVLLGFPADAAGVVEVVVFGHQPPLAVGPAGVRSLPGCDALPLGLAELTPAAPAPPPRDGEGGAVGGPVSAAGAPRLGDGEGGGVGGPASVAGAPPPRDGEGGAVGGPVSAAGGPVSSAGGPPPRGGEGGAVTGPAQRETPEQGPPVPPVHRVPVAADETVLLFTDGVTEARDRDDVFYPLEEEVARAVAADPGTAEPRRLVAFVRDGTLRHTRGHLADDTTLFAVRRAPLPGRSGPEEGRLPS
ncbi:MAG TPA: PP2C family protein-serine/threonine phosphatase [Streptomyces sp.]|nr:PP2C family protein-serine/threonine phosphatase [Streptomyces sp.]